MPRFRSDQSGPIGCSRPASIERWSDNFDRLSHGAISIRGQPGLQPGPCSRGVPGSCSGRAWIDSSKSLQALSIVLGRERERPGINHLANLG